MDNVKATQASGGKIWDPTKDNRDFQLGLPPGTSVKLDRRDTTTAALGFAISLTLCLIAHIQYFHLISAKIHSFKTDSVKGVFYITDTSIFEKLNWIEVIVAFIAPLLIIPTIRTFSTIFMIKFPKGRTEIRFTAQFFAVASTVISYIFLLNFMFYGPLYPNNTHKEEALNNWIKSELGTSEARVLESKTDRSVFYKSKDEKLYELVTVKDNKTTEYRLKLVENKR